MRGRRVRRHGARRGPAHLRAFDPDAQSRQRQGRRHRRRGPRAGATRRGCGNAENPLPAAGGAAQSRRRETGRGNFRSPALSYRAPRENRAGVRLPRRGAGGSAAGCAAVFRSREGRRALAFCRGKPAFRGAGAGRGRRVHLPQQLSAEPAVLRGAGREGGLRDVARAGPDDLQDRRLRRAGRAVLRPRRHGRVRLDRAPALPDEGARLAPGGRASVHRHE
ncbi:MAG: hypothetical protein BWY59_00351 [Verrucomicrobia bacterium ADurb.Bin345]|nr:MAG: hypothetical protein BWY59_00351 [Verrucomicrobia bacterium ADurb.Bin345]